MTTIKLNKSESRQKVKTVNGARYVHPCIGENETMQKHAAKFLDPVETAQGEVLPAGTVVSVTSSGMYNSRMAWGCSTWGDGRQFNIYSDNN